MVQLTNPIHFQIQEALLSSFDREQEQEQGQKLNRRRLAVIGVAATASIADLSFPHGIAFDTEGNLYVAVNSIISAPDAPAGQVIRIDGIAAA